MKLSCHQCGRELDADDRAGWAAWPFRGHVRIRLGTIRITATPDEAFQLASELVDAIDTLRGAREVPSGR
ncbi:hypothetical protein AWC11_27330 [Mycobacterium interjectum]|uniref:Mycobacterium terramassiliense ORFan n=1 Tax=Mycobacterium terramassiliense TaxID=1841859 RepID=A0A2U3NEK4_9MYCO|nr:hypothetical protein [Mycobacterium terramassiliense]ORV81061.1 hypothetical protein AWC11_27330 [Mycobacterium interjectum]SPM29948.1 Mycobacterium terramassiliense ORFan [Mycobacterium terramassiliense]